MTSNSSQPSDRDQRLQEILAEYLELVESGSPPDADEFLARYPEFADELTGFLDDHESIERFLDPLREGENGSNPETDPTIGFADPDVIEPGSKLRYVGDYEILEEIARGGMGVVYKARQVSLNRIVALKMILSGQFAHEQDVRRFRAEAEAAANLDHPGIVPIYEIGEFEGHHYFSMGLVEGASLAEKIKDGPLEPRTAAEYLKKIAQAVAFAHDNGVIHRDLKPGNVLIDANDQPKVTDFGLAKRYEDDSELTATGQILGTPGYMPPEQAAAMADQMGPLADVYSLGAVLYCLLTGRPPFQSANVVDTLRQVVHQEPVPPRQLNPAVPRDLETICLKCLEKAPAKRYMSAQDFADELHRYLNSEPIHARPISKTARGWRWCKRNPVVASLTAVVFALLLGTAAVSMLAYIVTEESLVEATDARRAANAETERAEGEFERAEAALASEQTQRKRAETTLVDMYTTHGLNAAKQDDVQESLLWFGTVAALAKEGSHREWANRLRFRNWARHLAVPIHAVRNPLGSVLDITIHPSNQYALIHTNKGVVLWDLESGVTSSHPRCHATWSVNGKMLALGSPGGSVEVVSFPDRAELFQFRVSGTTAPKLAFSRDDKLLAAGGQNVRIWNVDIQDFLPGEAGHPSPIVSLEFACHQTCLVTGARDIKARVFDIESTGVASSPRFAPVAHRGVGGGVGQRHYPPLIVNEDRAILGSRSLRLIDLQTGVVEKSFHFPGAPIMNATVNGSGDILSISGDFGGHVHSYDLRDGERLSTIEINRNRAPGIRFLPGHNMLATIGYDSVLRFWNVKSGARIGPEVRNFGECSVVSFSADGTLCAIAQPDQTVKLLRMPQATTKASATVDRESAGLPFEPSMDRSGRWFVPQSARWSAPVRELCVYETSTGRPCSATVVLSPEIISTAISADGILVAAVTAMPGTPAVKQNGNLERYSRRPGQVRIWDWLNNQFLGEPINTKTLPMDCAFSPDGTKLVVVCAFGKVLRIDVEQPKVDLETAHPGSTNYGYLLPKRMIRFSEEGDRFITAGIGKSVRVWTSEGKLLGELKHKNYVLDANFSTAGDYLVTACEDGIVNIWDARSCKAIGTPLKHPGKVNSATFDPSGEFIATVCSNRMVSVWDWRHSKRVCPDLEHTSNVYSASFNVDGKLLITAADNKVRFWERFTGRQVSSPRVVNTFTTLLVMNRKSQVAVVSSSRQSSVEPPRLASVYHTHELAPLDGLGFPSENLRTLAEIVSGRRIENGGSTALTSDQWWGRWEMSHPPVKEIVPLLSLVFIGVCVSSL